MGPESTIGILGGGLMGAGIAHVFAGAGHPVRVFEPLDQARNSLQEHVRSALRAFGQDESLAANVLAFDDLGATVSQADFITEAAPEKLELKRALFADLVRLAPRSAILASNTSVIPIGRIIEGLPTAERVVGTHWWNPAALIPLVEVVQAAQTTMETVRSTMELLASVGKSPAHIQKDVPGFVANRLQHALWREAIAMIADGICDPATLDACVKNSFGLRLAVLGPLENADMVGLDLTLDIHRTIMPELNALPCPNPYLEAKVAAGHLGFKSGEGFQKWSPDDMEALRERLASHLLAARRDRAGR